MPTTTLYYLLVFVLFIACIGGIQKWTKLPQLKKDRVGLMVLSIFLIAFIFFISIFIFNPNYFSADTSIPIGMLFFFLFIVFIAFFIKWYNDKYNKKINIGTVIITIFLSAFVVIFLVLKFASNTEKENIIKNVALNTIVTNITFDTHKPYFKDMTLATGQHLPMPEAMNNTLHIGDSIYKKKKENFYTVLSAVTKQKINYEVKIHLRVLSNPQ